MAQSGTTAAETPQIRFTQIEIRTVTSPMEVAEALGDRSRPVILRGLSKDWPAMNTWSFAHLKERYGAQEVHVSLDLPTEGIPYDELWSDYSRDVTLASFIDRITGGESNRPSYMDQRPIRQFEGAEQDLRFNQIPGATEGSIQVNLWIGSEGTRSGLHFDRYDNLFLQVCGTKRMYLAPPSESKHLYPYVDYVQKSQVDPEDPNFAAFPKLAKAHFWTGEVGPGDILYMPRQWWHHVRSLDPSISVNYWFGQSIGLFDQLGIVVQNGVACWLRTLRDFIWLGLFGRPYVGRMFSEAPTGKYLYDQLIGYRVKSAR